MKKKITALLAAVVLMLSLCSCGAKPNQIMLFPEAVKYKAQQTSNSTNEFSFNINSISDTKNLNIEYVGAEGENTEYISEVTFTDDTFDTLKYKKINGKYFRIQCVQIRTISDSVKIDSLTVKVNGKEQTLKFDTPIENRFVNSDENIHPLTVFCTSNYVTTSSFADKNETPYDFIVTAEADTTITKIRFDDFLAFANNSVSVNGSDKGTIKEALPLKLKKGDELRLCSSIKPKDDEKIYMCNIYTNVVAECEMGTERFVERCPFCAVCIGNEDNAKSFIEANVK